MHRDQRAGTPSGGQHTQELAVVVDRRDGAPVVERERQRIHPLQPSELVRAFQPPQPQDGGYRPLDDDGLGRRPAVRRRPAAMVPVGVFPDRRCGSRRPAQPDRANRPGRAIDVPGTGLAQDDRRSGRQVRRGVAIEAALAARDQALARRLPPRQAGSRQTAEHLRHQRSLHPGPRLGPAADQAGQ